MQPITSRLADVFDLERYPIHDPSHRRYRELVDYCRAKLADDGCCSVVDFFRANAITAAAAMAERLADQVHRPS